MILLIFCVPEPYAQHLFWQPVTTTPLAVEPSSLTSSSPLTLLTVLSEVLCMAYRDAATGNMASVWEDTSSESWIKDVSGSTPTNGSASGSNAETSRMGVSISEWDPMSHRSTSTSVDPCLALLRVKTPWAGDVGLSTFESFSKSLRKGIIGLAYQSQASTQLPFLFWDGAFSCLWEQMISENS